MRIGKITAVLAAAALSLGTCIPAFAAAPSDYSYLTAAFRMRKPYVLSCEDDHGKSLSQVLDEGSCYEVTGVSFYTHQKYKADDVRTLSVGSTFKISGKAYKVTEIRTDGVYVLERKDGYENVSREYLEPVNPGKNKTGYYIACRTEDASEDSFDSSDLYYTGSIFIRKDAVIRSGSLNADGSSAAVTPEQYLTQDSSTLGALSGNTAAGETAAAQEAFRYGRNNAEGTVTLCGDFLLDAEGYVTEYTEKY